MKTPNDWLHDLPVGWDNPEVLREVIAKIQDDVVNNGNWISEYWAGKYSEVRAKLLEYEQNDQAEYTGKGTVLQRLERLRERMKKPKPSPWTATEGYEELMRLITGKLSTHEQVMNATKIMKEEHRVLGVFMHGIKDTLRELETEINGKVSEKPIQQRIKDIFSHWKKQADHWKANHDSQVQLKRQLTDRPDLKDRAESVVKLHLLLHEAYRLLSVQDLNAMQRWRDDLHAWREKVNKTGNQVIVNEHKEKQAREKELLSHLLPGLQVSGKLRMPPEYPTVPLAFESLVTPSNWWRVMQDAKDWMADKSKTEMGQFFNHCHNKYGADVWNEALRQVGYTQDA